MRRAQRRGRRARANIEPGSQLNAAVERRHRLCALARGAAQALILPADVPLATPAELRSLIESPRRSSPASRWPPRTTATAPTPCCSPRPTPSPPATAPAATSSTCRRPWRASIDVHVMHLPGLARDIDEPADLVHSVGGGRRALRLSCPVPRWPTGHSRITPHRRASNDARPTSVACSRLPDRDAPLSRDGGAGARLLRRPRPARCRLPSSSASPATARA